MPVKKKSPTSGNSEPEPEPPEEEFVEPPPPPPVGDDFEFSEPHKAEAIPREALESLAKFCVYGVDLFHDTLYEATKYNGFPLTDKEKEMWQFLFENVLPHLPPKYVWLIVTGLMLSIAEGRKAVGYAIWRNEGKKAVAAATPQIASPQQEGMRPATGYLPPAPKEQIPDFSSL